MTIGLAGRPAEPVRPGSRASKRSPGRPRWGIIPGGATVFYDPFGVYAFSRDELMAVVVAVAAMAGLAALFRFTAIGLRCGPWSRARG